jgi:triosephosphate isomerase
MRKQIAAANWKMNLTLAEANKLADELLQTDHHLQDNQSAIFAVPFPYLLPVYEKLKDKKNVFVAAQNCSGFDNGAYTGEVSAAMLESMNIKYVIIGHSERREYNSESNSLIAEKINKALAHNICPVFCCGEPLHVRQAGTQNAYVLAQLKESLYHLECEAMENFIIAYEPIWAIGTGLTANNEQAQEMHKYIRESLATQFGNFAETISILYGGSVKAANAKEIFAMPDVDGGLVGGASLIAKEFSSIINSLK